MQMTILTSDGKELSFKEYLNGGYFETDREFREKEILRAGEKERNKRLNVIEEMKIQREEKGASAVLLLSKGRIQDVRAYDSYRTDSLHAQYSQAVDLYVDTSEKTGIRYADKDVTGKKSTVRVPNTDEYSTYLL